MAGGNSQASERGQSCTGVWENGACGGLGVCSASGTVAT